MLVDKPYVLFEQNVRTMRVNPSAALAAAPTAAPLDRARRRFVDDLGHLYARFGLSVTFGRAFALLLLSDQPISLEDLAAQLEVSKSAVSVAARELERLGIARRSTTPGSRRVLYEANDDMVPLFEAQFARVQQSLPVFRAAEPLTSAGHTTRRVHDLVELHEFWLAESQGILERWRQRKRRALE